MNNTLNTLETCLKNKNSAEAKDLLKKVKIALLTEPLNEEDIIQAVSALEIGAILSVHDEDLDSFSNFVAQVQPYYEQNIDKTPRRFLVTGLYLMHLLVENRLSEFHSQLELLTGEQASHPAISFAVGLERQLMVGMYDEILATPAPDPVLGFFVDMTVATVRDSMADGLEVGYQQLSVAQAAALLKMSESEFHEYVSEYRDDWMIKDGIIMFQPESGTQEIPSEQWIQQTLSYATEMERII